MLSRYLAKIMVTLIVVLDVISPIKAASAAQTPAAATANITVVNNKAGIDDIVTVKGLAEGTEVKAYDKATLGTVLGTATVEEGSTSVAITISDLGSVAGKVYITTKAIDQDESTRTAVAYSSDLSAAPSASTITVTNKYDAADTVTVSGLKKDDVITVYNAASGGSVLGTVTATATTMTINIEQLGTKAGIVYVTKSSTNKNESARTAKAYAMEPPAPVYGAGAIAVSNNATGTADKITVAGLAEGDTVKVYRVSTGGTVLGTATVESGQTKAILNMEQLGVAAGTIYVTRTGNDGIEGIRIKKTYAAEPATSAPSSSNIIIKNNKAGIDDTVTVKGLPGGTVVKIYSAATAGTVLGEATVDTWETSVTITIKELGTLAGKVYISAKSIGKNESAKTTSAYLPDITAAPSVKAITVSNKYSAYDKVTVTGLSVGDIVTVYDAATEGNVLGTVTATAASATVSVGQLGTLPGTVYVTRTNINKYESARTAKAFYTEAAAVFGGTFKVAPGSVGGSTKFTSIAAAADPEKDKLVYIITNLTATPVLETVGSTLSVLSSATELVAATNISGVCATGNNIIDIYEVNKSTGVILLSKRIKLTSKYIKAPSIISAYATGSTLTLKTDAALSASTTPTYAFKVKDGSVYNTVTAVAIENDTIILTLKAIIHDANTITVSYTKPSTAYLKDISGNPVVTMVAGKVKVRTALLKGATVIDKPGFYYDGIGIMKLPVAAPGDSFKYFIYDGTSVLYDPKVGNNISGWKKAVDGLELDLGFNAAVAHSKLVYIAEVDTQNLIVSVVQVNLSAIADYSPASSGYITGTVSFAQDADFMGYGAYICTVLAGKDRTFTISIDGGAAKTVTIPASVYDNRVFLRSINDVLSEAGKAQLDASGHLQIISNTVGPKSKVTVGGTDAALFFGSSPKKVVGLAEAH